MREDLIERLRREADISARPGQMDRLNALADEFADALEAAREDAHRYRWLRVAHGSPMHGMWHVRQYDNTVIGQQPEELDAAIDQARGKGVVSCRCHTERDKELCLNKRECVAIFPHGGKGIVPEQGESDRG